MVTTLETPKNIFCGNNNIMQSVKTLKVGDMTVNVQEAAADRHLVLYDNFYHGQHVLHKKVKFIHPLNCRSLIYKQNGNSQQAAFRHS